MTYRPVGLIPGLDAAGDGSIEGGDSSDIIDEVEEITRAPTQAELMNEKILRRGGTYCIQVTVHGVRHESIPYAQRPTKSQRQSFRRKYDRSYSRDSTWNKTAYVASINAQTTAEDKRAAEPTIAAVKALMEVEKRQHQARRLATSAKRSESPPASASE